jgi:hypothetical protein
MSGFYGRARLLLALIPGLFAILGATSCSHLGQSSEQAKVSQAFNSWKEAMINNQTDLAMTYIPSHVDDYLHVLNSAPESAASSPTTPPSQSPGVDLLLRTALEKKVPADLRTNLTLSGLLQRITDRKLFNPRDLRQIALGRISVTGDRASAEVKYQDMLTALHLPFIKENGAWKIDVMAIIPYAEVLMRVDRAVKNESQTQQVDQLVSKLPSL